LIGGDFGFARETSAVFGAACRLAAEKRCGLGAAYGEVVENHGGPGLDTSLLVAARRAGIPLTVHVAVGTDIVHMSGDLDGAALGTATLDALGAKLLGFSAFPDHYSYTRKDVDEIAKWAAALDADLLLTTQKDLVKLRTNQIGRVPLRAVRIGLEVTEGRMILDEALATIVCATRLPN
jgi:hypothetical protein